jgi:hypothetical protein
MTDKALSDIRPEMVPFAYAHQFGAIWRADNYPAGMDFTEPGWTPLYAIDPAFLARIEALEAENAHLLQSGCWTASIYHCPPPARKSDNPLRHASTIRVTGTFATEAEAIAKANAVIKEGRPAIDIFIHQQTAKSRATFHVSQDALNAFARAALTQSGGHTDG